jgi:hypothetical protein
MCGTTLIQEISPSKYTFKEVATDKSGICAKISDFQIDYTYATWLKARHDLSCHGRRHHKAPGSATARHLGRHLQGT